MRKIVLYTYHIDEERFSQTSNLMLEQEAVNLENYNDRGLIFAVSAIPDVHIRIPIASHPGLVYYDRNSATYRVWFDAPDRDKAIEAIGTYILVRIAPEIRTHQSFIKRLQNERADIIESLENLPSD